MSPFVYLIAEGVLDVAFLTQVLCKRFGFVQVKARSQLPEPAQQWALSVLSARRVCLLVGAWREV
jgi:hypothetical protein